MSALPDLGLVFFPNDVGPPEGEDHAEDSCCLSFDRTWLADDKAKWIDVRNQHFQALTAMAGVASRQAREGNGWLMGRPLVFAAHHVAELSLKVATLPLRNRWRDGRQNNGHDLAYLLALDRAQNGVRDTSEWEDTFVTMLERAQEAGRFPDRREGQPLFDQWCCVSATALFSAVMEFSALVASTNEVA